MSNNKTQQYVSDKLNEIIEQTREFEAYTLGVANGYYQFYQYYKSEFGEDVANKSFKSFLNGTNKCNKHFRKLIELGSEKDSDINEIMNKLKECLDKTIK